MLAIYTLAARLLINLNFSFGEKVPFLDLAPTPYKGVENSDRLLASG
ncbi:hypothetical protein OGM63_25555 [Plectonema radiosum NIES-515]|uniref:Uncharacterized protein n=1 Tax=Plectonema radiosum NIES-515 TaxID=2986073 RepID=A0ABT3B622_9CYAN|nr:hypothetical protein [Plectonema radiosum]MCV3216832.1 hypothetical protein [Plectonema radiosum NIES-515]